MKILIDGDSCNTIKETIKEAKKNNTEVHIYCDTQHYIHSNYATVHIVDSGMDAVDFAIVNAVEKGDIVYTNDGGLASMVKAKSGVPKNFKGVTYSENDITAALNARYLRNAKMKQAHTKNLLTKHGQRKQKTIYIRECWC